ncbi:MAG: cupredoxin family copper-binding protein [Methylococcaceae bacterium]
MNSLFRSFFSISLLLISFSVAAATVTIQNFVFTPGVITINLGDSVKWINQDASPHSTTQTDNLWSNDLSTGQSFSREFTTPGTFNYHCRFHPSMTGTIKVRNADQSRINIGQSIIAAAPKALPIKLNLAGKVANAVYMGSYLVNTQAGCANCHSCPTYAVGHNPHNGEVKQFNATSYLAGGVRIEGLISPNLTPDTNGNPAGLTRTEFKDLLRTGHDPDMPGHILQVMPWPIFGQMSDNDLNAIYAYLTSIPKANTPANTCSIGQ